MDFLGTVVAKMFFGENGRMEAKERDFIIII